MRTIAATLLLAASAQCFADARVFLVNVAPQPDASASVNFAINSETVSELSYTENSRYLDVTAGLTQVSATIDGTVVSREIDFADGYDYTVALGPQGPGRDGYTLHLMFDHNHPITTSSITVQRANLAAVNSPVVFGINCASQAVEKTATGTRKPLQLERAFGHGTVTPELSSHNLQSQQRIGARAFSCEGSVGAAGDSRSQQLSLPEGSATRLFAIGDGENQPLAALFVQLEAREVLPGIGPEIGMEGLWFSPQTPGEGLALIWNSNTRRLETTYFGFNEAGQSRWYSAAPGRSEFQGDSEIFAPREFRQTTTFDGDVGLGSVRLGSYDLYFHSCSSATAVMQLTPPFGVSFNVRDFPHNALKLSQIASSGSACAETEKTP